MIELIAGASFLIAMVVGTLVLISKKLDREMTISPKDKERIEHLVTLNANQC